MRHCTGMASGAFTTGTLLGTPLLAHLQPLRLSWWTGTTRLAVSLKGMVVYHCRRSRVVLYLLYLIRTCVYPAVSACISLKRFSICLWRIAAVLLLLLCLIGVVNANSTISRALFLSAISSHCVSEKWATIVLPHDNGTDMNIWGDLTNYVNCILWTCHSATCYSKYVRDIERDIPIGCSFRRSQVPSFQQHIRRIWRQQASSFVRGFAS